MHNDKRKTEMLNRFGTDLTRMIGYYGTKLELPVHEILGMIQITTHAVMAEIEREVKDSDEDDEPDFPWDN